LQVSQLSSGDLHTLSKVISEFIDGNMVPSLSTLTNDEVKFVSIKTSELGLNEISNIIPQTEFKENDVGIYISCDGDVKLGILFHLPLADAKKLASILTGSKTNSDLSSMGKSSLTEIGNILAASLFNAINAEKGCKITSSIPGLAIDTAEALLESPIIETAVSDTFIHTFGELHCINSKIIIFASIFQDPFEAKKLLNTIVET
jgi:chemotaxis protein CheY-P-specific phosphatase CheC